MNNLMTRNESKFAMNIFFSLLTALYGFFSAIEVSKVCAFAIGIYICCPFVISFMPLNTCMAAFAIFVGSAILSILFTCSGTQIRATIIERISIPMIALNRWISKSKDKSVHQWSSMRSAGIERFGTWIPLRVPQNIQDTFVIGCINNRNLSLCERNKSYRLILRLNNRFAGNAILDHDSTSNGIAAFSRIAIIAKKLLYFLFFSLCALPLCAQNGSIQGYCNLGGSQSLTSGLPSSNYLQGVIPYCTITVYLTGTTTYAQLYSNSSGTPLTNPFKANADGSFLFYAETSAAVDVVASGGAQPNIYPSSKTILTDVFPGGSGGGSGGITQIINDVSAGPGTGTVSSTVNSMTIQSNGAPGYSGTLLGASETGVHQNVEGTPFSFQASGEGGSFGYLSLPVPVNGYAFNTVWSAEYLNTGNNGITNSYADACTYGGSVQIEENYSGTDVIPYNCTDAGVVSPVQTNPQVNDLRNGQSARTGFMNALDFGANNTGVSDSSIIYLSGILESASCKTIDGDLRCLPTYWPTGHYQVHEVAIPTSPTNYSSEFMWRGAFPGSTYIYYGGTGGNNSYMIGAPSMSFGGIENISFEGVNPGSTVTSMAQNFMNITQTSDETVDSSSIFDNFGIQKFYGDAFTVGTSSSAGEIVNGYFTHWRTDGLGGYFLRLWSNGDQDGNPIDLRDYTMDNNLTGSAATYAIAQGYVPGTGSTPSSNGAGEFWCNSCGSTQLINVDTARIEENLPTTTVGNNDQGRFYFNNDSGNGNAVINFKNYDLAGNSSAPHPVVSTNNGGVSIEFVGRNYVLNASSLYKNRTTQLEYGDGSEAQGALWSFGANPNQFQGMGLETWLLDVIPLANRSTNTTLRHPGDWFVRRGIDFIPGESGPFDVVVSPASGRASMESTETVTIVGTLAANGSNANITNFSPAYISGGPSGSVHINDWLVIKNSGSGGSGNTTVQVTCVAMNSTYSGCSGLTGPGIVVTPAPACLSSSGCPSAGGATVYWAQTTLSNFGLEANRVSSLPSAGSTCPYEGDFEWLQNPVAGAAASSECNSSLQWVTGPAMGTLPAYPGTGTYTTATSDTFTVTGATSSSHCTFSPTNSTAAAATVVGYISAVSTNSVTITHVATTASGGTVDILCTSN